MSFLNETVQRGTEFCNQSETCINGLNVNVYIRPKHNEKWKNIINPKFAQTSLDQA